MVTAGRGFAGPGTLARGLLARSGDERPHVRRRLAGLNGERPENYPRRGERTAPAEAYMVPGRTLSLAFTAVFVLIDISLLLVRRGNTVR